MPNPTTKPVSPAAVDRLRVLIEADPRPLGELASRAGLNRDHLYQIRSGRRRDPSLSTVGAILAALGKDWADLDAG